MGASHDTLTLASAPAARGQGVVTFTPNGTFYMLNKPLTPLKLVHGMPILHFIARYEPCKQPSRSYNPLHTQLVFTVKLDLKYYNFFKNLASTLAFNSKKALKIKAFFVSLYIFNSCRPHQTNEHHLRVLFCFGMILTI